MRDRVTPGQPQSENPLRTSRGINRTMEATDYYQGQKARGDLPPPQQPPQLNGDFVKIRNDTGQNLLRGYVVQLNDYLLDPVDPRNLWFAAGLPDSTQPRFGYAIVQEDFKHRSSGDQQIGWAQVTGVTMAVMQINTTIHKRCRPVNGSAVMQSSYQGPIEILANPAGIADTGLKCLVKLNAEGDMTWVQVWHGGTFGELTAPNASNLHPARVRDLTQSYENAWLHLMDSYDTGGGASAAIDGTHMLAKYAGTATVSSDTRPLYLARSQNWLPVAASLAAEPTVPQTVASSSEIIDLDEVDLTNSADTHRYVYVDAANSRLYIKSPIKCRFGWSVTIGLPETVTGTKYAPGSTWRWEPFTIRPQPSGGWSGSWVHRQRQDSFLIPPAGAAVGANNLPDVDDWSEQVLTISNSDVIDYTDISGSPDYIDLRILDAKDAVIYYANMWVQPEIVFPVEAG